MTQALLLLAVCAAAEYDFEPNFRRSNTEHGSAIRDFIFVNRSYDAAVPPASDRAASGTTYAASGTDVELSIRMFKIINVDAAAGSIVVKVWVRMWWSDLRLAWDADAFGGVDETYFKSDGEIWLPDLQPYNAHGSFKETLEPALAKVKSSGSVYLVRTGTVDIMCKFSGLVAFPFDNPVCFMEVGGWIMSGAYQGLAFRGDGFEFSLQELTSGSSYQEYSIADVDAKLLTYSYASAPSEPWPIAVYRIQLKRASMFYVFIVILPGILVTFLSFSVFWTPTEVADPLGFGISVIVVALLGNLVLVSMLPVCGEVLWINLFAVLNTIFCCLALFQSAVVILIENHDGGAS